MNCLPAGSRGESRQARVTAGRGTVAGSRPPRSEGTTGTGTTDGLTDAIRVHAFGSRGVATRVARL